MLLHRAKQEFKTEYVKRFGGLVPLDSGASTGMTAVPSRNRGGIDEDGGQIDES